MLEMLFYSLRQNKGDREVREILRDLKSKGYARQELINQTREQYGALAEGRVRRLSI